MNLNCRVLIEMALNRLAALCKKELETASSCCCSKAIRNAVNAEASLLCTSTRLIHQRKSTQGMQIIPGESLKASNAGSDCRWTRLIATSPLRSKPDVKVVQQGCSTGYVLELIRNQLINIGEPRSLVTDHRAKPCPIRTQMTRMLSFTHHKQNTGSLDNSTPGFNIVRNTEPSKSTKASCCSLSPHCPN